MRDLFVLDAQNRICYYFEFFEIDGHRLLSIGSMNRLLHGTVDQPAHPEAMRRHEDFILVSPGFQGGASILV